MERLQKNYSSLSTTQCVFYNLSWISSILFPLGGGEEKKSKEIKHKTPTVHLI